MEYKCGYVAILGRPNAGKSTLVNCLVGEKVAIVSPKPQTTRNNILGILTKDNYQIILVDTPGIHKSKNALDKYMMKNVRSAIGGAMVNVYLLDCSKRLEDSEFEYIQKLAGNETPLILALSKIDLKKFEDTIPLLAKLSQIKEIKDIVPISSLKNKNTQDLVEQILKYIPSSAHKNFEFDEDEYTDKSLRFIASETIREKALLSLNQEIPHGINVSIINFEEKKDIVIIEADIVCERESHKSIIIGKKGTMLKIIGENARKELENLMQKKVLLKLFVKTKKNWRENNNFLNEFGYKKED
ncbi:MAG: GTPase Era [Clostridia bacterium]|nr:GTPase Era [Clostridia bacterium]